MSPDLEIIMMVASILEKSKLIVSGVNAFSGNTEPLVTCIIRSVVLLQYDIDISGCVTSFWLKLFKIQNVLKLLF